MSSRACLIAAAVLLSGCSSERPLKLPAEVAGGWKLSAEQPADSAAVPEGPAAQSALAGVYEGPAKVTARVFSFANQAVAFEKVQKSRPAPGSIFLQEDRHFILVESPGTGNAALNDFAKAFIAELRKKE